MRALPLLFVRAYSPIIATTDPVRPIGLCRQLDARRVTLQAVHVAAHSIAQQDPQLQ